VSKRIFITGLIALGCCLLGVTASAAGLDAACREAQLAVQAAVGDENPAIYKNHGAYVAAATAAANPFLESGQIDAECHSCIINQFARRIPIAQQTPCGPDSPNPECQGASCGTFQACNLPNSCTDPVCATTSEGGGLCVEGTTGCSGLTLCPGGTSDCPAGSICVVNTCCVDPVCIPPDAFCQASDGAAPARQATPAPGTRTISSQGN